MLRAPFVSIPPTATNRRNQNNTPNPFSYNILLTSFTCGKILISLFVLRIQTEHSNMLKNWLICATLCDMINAAVLIVDTKRLISRHMFPTHQLIEANTPLLEPESPLTPQPGAPGAASPIFWTCSRITVTANNCYYLLLWAWGHYLYYSYCAECFQSMEAVTNVVFLYLYCGYFYLGAALLMAIFDHSYLSFITFSHLSLASKTKTVTENASPKLPTKPYSLDTTGSEECYICLANYKEGDNLAELPCDSKHQFHRRCIRKWLKINNACPLCRKSVGKCSKAEGMNEVELPVMIV